MMPWAGVIVNVAVEDEGGWPTVTVPKICVAAPRLLGPQALRIAVDVETDLLPVFYFLVRIRTRQLPDGALTRMGVYRLKR